MKEKYEETIYKDVIIITIMIMINNEELSKNLYRLKVVIIGIFYGDIGGRIQLLHRIENPGAQLC
jgi:hypothetical protein